MIFWGNIIGVVTYHFSISNAKFQIWGMDMSQLTTYSQSILTHPYHFFQRRSRSVIAATCWLSRSSCGVEGFLNKFLNNMVDKKTWWQKDDISSPVYARRRLMNGLFSTNPGRFIEDFDKTLICKKLVLRNEASTVPSPWQKLLKPDAWLFPPATQHPHPQSIMAFLR